MCTKTIKQCSSLYEVYAVNTREPFRVFYYTIYDYLYFIRVVTSTYLNMVTFTLQHMVAATLYEWLLLLIYIW